VYTLTGSQRLIQDVRETTNYGYEQLLRERFPVRLHDTRLRVSWRVTPWQAGSTAAGRLPPSVRRRLPSFVRRPPASTTHHRPATGQSHAMFSFAAALLCFSSIP